MECQEEWSWFIQQLVPFFLHHAMEHLSFNGRDCFAARSLQRQRQIKAITNVKDILLSLPCLPFRRVVVLLTISIKRTSWRLQQSLMSRRHHTNRSHRAGRLTIHRVKLLQRAMKRRSTPRSSITSSDAHSKRNHCLCRTAGSGKPSNSEATVLSDGRQMD